MRIYKADGSFEDNPDDTEFGWYFPESVIDADESGIENEETAVESPVNNPKEDSFLESVDVTDLVEPVLPPIKVEKIDPHIDIQPVVGILDCKMEIEGIPLNRNEPEVLRDIKNINSTVPTKEKLANLINPCNFETKMLMSIIYFAKYKSLAKQETSDEVFKSVNYRTTNFKCLIKENDVDAEMYKEIQNYHATKEENMLSLMMELILTDMNCNLEDIVDVNQPRPLPVLDSERDVTQFVVETSDLGNSIQSSCSSKGWNRDRSNYLSLPNRSSIISSIGLGEEDKSIQSISVETLEMQTRLAEIKKSFLDDEDRINNLIKIAMDLEKDLKETLYLDDILHLLKGDIEKVKLKKLPFRIFHKDEEKGELNLIV